MFCLSLFGRFRFWAPTRFLEEVCPRYDLDTTSSPSSPKQVQEAHKPGLFQSCHPQSNYYRQIFYITISKISYNLIKPQLLPYAPVCGYKYHALTVYLHTTFTSPFQLKVDLESSRVNILRLLVISAEDLHFF